MEELEAGRQDVSSGVFTVNWLQRRYRRTNFISEPGLMLRSFICMLNFSTGFGSANVVTAKMKVRILSTRRINCCTSTRSALLGSQTHIRSAQRRYWFPPYPSRKYTHFCLLCSKEPLQLRSHLMDAPWQIYLLKPISITNKLRRAEQLTPGPEGYRQRLNVHP